MALIVGLVGRTGAPYGDARTASMPPGDGHPLDGPGCRDSSGAWLIRPDGSAGPDSPIGSTIAFCSVAPCPPTRGLGRRSPFVRQLLSREPVRSISPSIELYASAHHRGTAFLPLGRWLLWSPCHETSWDRGARMVTLGAGTSDHNEASDDAPSDKPSRPGGGRLEEPWHVCLPRSAG